ncbi:unnamed protein product [Plutella xylostella]|uniref:DNA 5'-3' helicase n=1 Tax=Plutella xylostella TaxID=51655 RepID=A0A8S4E048_PLUXY|nr:unnamed protein product [Plutella xylostella]
MLSLRIFRFKFQRLNINHFKSESHCRRLQTLGLDDIPSITATEIRKLLRQKGLAVQDGCTSLVTKCVICAGEQKADQGKIFINKTTGYFLCPKCNVHGEWKILERIVKKAKLDAATKDYIEKTRQKSVDFRKDWDKIVSETSSVADLNENEAIELFRLFEFPFHPDSHKVLSAVRVTSDHTILYFPLTNSADTVIGYRKLQAGNEEESQCHGLDTIGLFQCKAPKVPRLDQAVLVPTIQDVLNLAAHKVPGSLIWLSACSLPPALLPVLEGHPRLCLWGPWDNMRAVAEKLGEDRCRFIRPTDGLVTASEAAGADLSLKTLVSEAKPAAHRSITTFASLRDDVYAELTNIDKVRGVKWRRFPALSKLLGGHRRGELTVLTGPTGCGKTTLCAEMSLDLAEQGVTTLWGSFEIRNARLARTMLQQFAGVPLERHLADFPAHADRFEKLPLYYLAFHGQQPIKVVMEAVEHARYMHDIAHVVVDNVQFMVGVAGAGEGDDRFRRQDVVVAAFRAFATARHTHVTLVMHPRKERDSDDLSTSSIFGSAKASQEADNVLIIQDKRLTAVRGKKYLQVAKNRYSGDLGIVPLEFDKDALSYQAKKKKGKDEPDRVLNQSLEEFSIQDQNYVSDFDQRRRDGKTKKTKNNAVVDSYLNDILNLNRTR